MDELERDLFRDLCENSADLIQSVSPEGKYLYVNDAWLSTLGYTRGEVAGLTVFDVIHPDSRAHCERLMARLFSGERLPHIEADFTAKDGRRIPVVGSATCRFENGRPAATRGIFHDISAWKRAEEEIDRLFNLSLDLLCVAGTDGFFKRINPAFEQVLGYTREELLSRAFVEFVHPDDRASTLKEVENLAQGLPVVDFQNRYRARDGSYRWLAWRSAPWPSEGLIYAVARDITEQKRSQEVMAEQALELARSNADLEQFAYVASHDLQAPLRAVSKLVQWIENDMPGELPEKVREHLAALGERVRRMETLTEDLLRYSRAGREKAKVESVDTASMIPALVRLLEPPRGFSIEVKPGLPTLHTERALLEQVLRNLLENAIKHHDRPAEGRVVVSSRELGDLVEFSLADDGPGIEPHYHKQIFQMFQKGGSTDAAGSTGIGLALVQRIVERLGGKIWVESGEGRGATFRFTWPRSDRVKDSPETPAGSEIDPAPPKARG